MQRDCDVLANDLWIYCILFITKPKCIKQGKQKDNLSISYYLNYSIILIVLRSLYTLLNFTFGSYFQQKWKTRKNIILCKWFHDSYKISQVLNFIFCSIQLETWKFCKHSFESDFSSSTLSIIETIQKSHLSGSSIWEFIWNGKSRTIERICFTLEMFSYWMS